MIDTLAPLIQAVMIWSQFVGILTTPLALGCLIAATFKQTLRERGVHWALVLLWPWNVYAWVLGTALCLSAWGSWGFGFLVALWWFGLGAAALGLVAAIMSGQLIPGVYLLGACLLVFGARRWSAKLTTEAGGPTAEPQREARPLREQSLEESYATVLAQAGREGLLVKLAEDREFAASLTDDTERASLHAELDRLKRLFLTEGTAGSR
jgi:hypothetical protein